MIKNKRSINRGTSPGKIQLSDFVYPNYFSEDHSRQGQVRSGQVRSREGLPRKNISELLEISLDVLMTIFLVNLG